MVTEWPIFPFFGMRDPQSIPTYGVDGRRPQLALLNFKWVERHAG
jgi:hypothetical protein